jgi:spore coat protein CotF
MVNTANQIAVKNLQSLIDILGAEKLNYEKLDTYIGIVKDPALRTLLTNLKEAGKAHYGAVYNYLKSHQA